jgi:4-oxalocrotonate tautomerase
MPTSRFGQPVFGASDSMRARFQREKEEPMPLINVRLIEGVFSPEQKKQMQEKLTDAMVSIEGESMRPVTMVIVDEVPSGQWAIGGKPLTTEDVKKLAAGEKLAVAA